MLRISDGVLLVFAQTKVLYLLRLIHLKVSYLKSMPFVQSSLKHLNKKYIVMEYLNHIKARHE
jgi:hypothetical protein